MRIDLDIYPTLEKRVDRVALIIMALHSTILNFENRLLELWAIFDGQGSVWIKADNIMEFLELDTREVTNMVSKYNILSWHSLDIYGLATPGDWSRDNTLFINLDGVRELSARSLAVNEFKFREWFIHEMQCMWQQIQFL